MTGRTLLVLMGTAALSVYAWRAHQQAVFERQVSALTDVNASQNDTPTLVYFWAPWCNACRIMGPQFAEAARNLESNVRVLKVNVDAEPALANTFSIHSIPALAVFNGGREVSREGGVMTSSDMTRWVQSCLSSEGCLKLSPHPLGAAL